MRPCSQAAVGGVAGHGAPAPTTLRRVTATRGQGDDGALEFPEGFTWGVATAAHQIEGGNVNNDWWAWEHNPASGTLEPSGDACDSFTPLARGPPTRGRHGPRGLPLLAGVEPH